VYGSDVAITFRQRADAAESVCSEISALGRHATVHRADLAEAESVIRAFDEVVEEHGRVHTVVVAAGSNIGQPFLADTTEEQWAEVIENDLNGFFRIAKKAIPHMREQGGGSFVHISSAGLLRTPPKDVLSVAPKAGIEALIKYIAKEEGIHNIRANSVSVSSRRAFSCA
jgi:NAD(P)-dependent dehydrogenase (short-subunit alcohol dehydrogenase family)